MQYKHQISYGNKKHQKTSGVALFFRTLFRFLTFPFRSLKNDKTGRKKKFIKTIILMFLIIFIAGGLIGGGYVLYLAKTLPPINVFLERQIAQSSKIYDRTGEILLYEIAGDEKRTIIKLDDLPEHVSQAVISLEDFTFYKHNGYRYRRIVKAALYKLLGRRGPGASTITSQLVKNALLSNERSIVRKIKEWIMVYKTEKNFTKNEILEMYLNEIPYGSTAYGIEAASNYYFDKEAKELTLPESAVLAAIIQKPSYFSPYGENKNELLDRKDLTLFLMEEYGYINEEQMEEAQYTELVFKPKQEPINAPHFVFYVRDLLEEKYGEHIVKQGGLEVITTLDWEKQQIAEQVIKEQAEINLQQGATNAALVSLDPTNGEILAMVGSVDYFESEHTDGQVNVVTRPRQPGSSFKPIVYTNAWQKGYIPSTVIFDVVTKFPGAGKAYEPRNYDLKERGPISLRKALQGSLNVPAVKLLYLVGVDSALGLAKSMGYTTLDDPERYGLSLVLGGAEVKLLEHTAAYATLAAEGVYHEPLAILEVKTDNDQQMDEFESEGKKVLDENIARITNNVLSDDGSRAYAFGAGSLLTIPGRQIAAKTGTTNDYRDAWTMGYTPNLATGVWVGNNDFTEMNRGAGGSIVAAPIWNKYMRQVLQDMENLTFTTPKISVPEKPVLSGKSFGVEKVVVDKASEKLATDLTPETFREERLYIDAHTILYYVDKKNPLGEQPADPASSDPQFTTWEEAVQNWIEKSIEENKPIFENMEEQELPDDIEIVYGLPPEENDDLHTPANQPSVRIDEPDNNEKLTTRQITAKATATAPRGVSRVEFYIDNILIGTVTEKPYEIQSSLKTFANGYYTLKAVAYDDIDNNKETTQRIKLQADESFVRLQWETPENNTTYQVEETPVQLTIDLQSEDKINQITFFEKNLVTGESKIIEAIVSPQQGKINVSWQPSGSGEYNLYAKLSVEGYGVLNSANRTVTIETTEEKESETDQSEE